MAKHDGHESLDLPRTCFVVISRLRLLVVVDIDDRLLPLASRNAATEHDVDFTVRAVLHLRQAPPGDGETDEGRGTPDVTALAAD